jgi:hypothetical protein
LRVVIESFVDLLLIVECIWFGVLIFDLIGTGRVGLCVECDGTESMCFEFGDTFVCDVEVIFFIDADINIFEVFIGDC